MKIVYFGFVIHYGGGPKAVVDICSRLSARHEVAVIDAYGACPAYLEDLAKANLPVTVLVPGAKRTIVGHAGNRVKRLLALLRLVPTYLRLVLRLRRAVKELRPDVVWMNIKTPMLFWGITPGVGSVPAVRSVIECPNPERISRLEKWVFRRKIHRFVAVSTESRRRLEQAGVAAEKIDVVSDTLNPERLFAKSRMPLEDELPGMGRFPKVLVPSTLLRTKGQHTAIRAIHRLKSEGGDAVLWLAGDVVGSNTSYLQELHRMVEEFGLADNVFFLGWREDIPALMRQADMVAFPTHSEGFGLVVLEGFLLKKPVVTTLVGGIRDQVEEGVNALTFDVDDDAAMARCIQRLAADPELAGRLTEAGYRTAVEKFSPEKNTQGYESVFETVVRETSAT